jgi:hypothetical protein
LTYRSPPTTKLKHHTDTRQITTWKTITLHGKHAYDLENSNGDNTASNTWLNLREMFSESYALLIASQDYFVSRNNYENILSKTRILLTPAKI